MKYNKCAIVFLMLILIICVPFTVSAMDTGLETQALSAEEISDIARQWNFVKITSYTPMVVKSFDVRDDHMVVIGAIAGVTAVISVYDNLGIFQYGFETTEYGSFRVMWSGDAIAYYSIRSNLIFKITEDGEITDIHRVANTMENSIYDRDVLESRVRNVDDATYRMTNESVIANALSSSFTKIVKTDSEGTTVIYDASSNRRTRTVGGLVAFLVFSIIFVSGSIAGIKSIVKDIKTRREQGDGFV